MSAPSAVPEVADVGVAAAPAAVQAAWLASFAELVGLAVRAPGQGSGSGDADVAGLLVAFTSLGIGRRRAGVAGAGQVSSVLEAVEQSPLPAAEWTGLVPVLGEEAVGELLDISLSSLRRYRGGERSTPDPVAARLHFVALVVTDLAGSYNEFGIRRWFQRARTALDGRSPAGLLHGDWDPDDSGPRRVRALSSALVWGGP